MLAGMGMWDIRRRTRKINKTKVPQQRAYFEIRRKESEGYHKRFDQMLYDEYRNFYNEQRKEQIDYDTEGNFDFLPC